VRTVKQRNQRTLARPAEAGGIGFLTSAQVRIRFLPAAPDTGIVFVRTDLKPAVRIEARLENVTGTDRRTTLGQPPAQVSLVEHVLAALAGLRIDNCIVELNAPEPPGLDGSALKFVEALRKSGTILQAAVRPICSVEESVVVQAGGASLSLHPGTSDELKISFILDYGSPSPIGRQAHTQIITPESFANDLANCRTYVLDQEAHELRRQGLGERLTTADLLVIGPHGPIGNRYRHANELVRHKILDIVGDLSLLGHDLCGHLVAYRSGHSLNVELARALCQTARRSLRAAA